MLCCLLLEGCELLLHLLHDGVLLLLQCVKSFSGFSLRLLLLLLQVLDGAVDLIHGDEG